MDVEKWLQDTANAGELSLRLERDALPASTQTNAVQHGKQRKMKQDRWTDSSIIEPQQIPSHSKHDEHLPIATEFQHASRGGSFSPSIQSPEEQTSQSEDNPYQRRKRRKTRPDRYEEKPSTSPRHVRSKRKNNQKSKERARTRRKVKGAAQDAVVRDYKAKNVSTNRLTIPSKSNVGIFRKGRASSPFKARGVPDLTFSEMKFLQKHRDTIEEEQPKKIDSANRKRDRMRAAEEEVSTYFVPKKLPLTERDPNIASKAPSHSKSPNDGHGDRTDKVRSMVKAQNILAGEALKKTSLAIGNSGDHVPPHFRSRSSTHFSWSDSIVNPSVHGHHRHKCDTIGVGELKIPLSLQTSEVRNPRPPVVANGGAPAVELATPQKRAEDKRPLARDHDDVVVHRDIGRREMNDLNSLPVQEDQQQSSNDIPDPSLLAERNPATSGVKRTSKHQRNGAPLGDGTVVGEDSANQLPASQISNAEQQGDEARSESSELRELLQLCKHSVIKVREPHVTPYAHKPSFEPHRVSFEGHVASQRFDDEVEYAHCQTGRTSILSGSDGLPDLTGPLHRADELSQGQAVPEPQSDVLVGIDAALWGPGSDFGMDHAGVATNQSSFGSQDEAAHVGNPIVNPVQDARRVQNADDLLVSVHSARGRQGLDDWYEDVPAGFWRPNKLY